MEELRPLVIGDLVVEKPIIQGGMGVGISLHRLAGAVAKAWRYGDYLPPLRSGSRSRILPKSEEARPRHSQGNEAGPGDCPGGSHRF